MTRQPHTSLLIVPRERFELLEQCVKSALPLVSDTIELIVVIAGAPKALKMRLQQLAVDSSITLIDAPTFLTPNQARNMAACSALASDYLVFLDNDVLGESSWLDTLISTARDTGADVVTPLTCIGLPLASKIHCAGGTLSIKEDQSGETYLCQKWRGQEQPLEQFNAEQFRGPTELAEFHCMLIKRATYESLGGFDEKFSATAEHVDVCFLLQRSKGLIFFEPKSVVTYVPGPLTTINSRLYFCWRWSDLHMIESVQYLKEKWAIGNGRGMRYRLQNPHWRRKRYFLGAFLPSLRDGGSGTLLARATVKAERLINSLVVYAYDRWVRGRPPV